MKVFQLIVNVLALANVFAHARALAQMYNLFLGLTSECNFMCRPCHHYRKKGRHTKNKIDIKSLKRFFEMFGFPCVAYIGGGGEPTLSDDYEQVVNLLNNNSVTIIIITNGSQLTRLKNIHSTQFTNFIISLPSVNDKLYSDYTGCVSSSVLQEIKKSIKLLNRNTIIQVTLVKQNSSDENIMELFRFCETTNIKYISFQIASPTMNGDKSCYLDKEGDEYYQKAIQLGKQFNVDILGVDGYPDYYKCFYGIKNFNANSIVIQENGMILCCCSPDAVNIGNINNSLKYNSIFNFKKHSDICRKCGEL